jgi:hypothetical protein
MMPFDIGWLCELAFYNTFNGALSAFPFNPVAFFKRISHQDSPTAIAS